MLLFSTVTVLSAAAVMQLYDCLMGYSSLELSPNICCMMHLRS